MASPATADVYVAVDSNGNAVGGAIMCDAQTCAEGSPYSQATLKAGERYALQGTGDSGIGNNNPNTSVKVDLTTNEWTVTRQQTVQLPEPVLVNNQQVVAVTTQTVEKINTIVNVTTVTPSPNIDTSTALSDTAIVVILPTKLTASAALALIDWNSPNVWEQVMVWISLWFEELYTEQGVSQ